MQLECKLQNMLLFHRIITALDNKNTFPIFKILEAVYVINRAWIRNKLLNDKL